MKRKHILFFLIVFCSYGAASAQQIYDARIGEKEILTPLPEKLPRINGP